MMDNGDKCIVHLCADTGSDSEIYKKNGYNVARIGKAIGVENAKPQPYVYGIIANPVCTEFSIAKGFHREGDYQKGMTMVHDCMRFINGCRRLKNSQLKFWVIENPASGKLKDFLGKPRFVYQPWEFGSPWTKKTALWGNFNIPEKLYTKWEDVPKIEGLYIRPRRSKPSIAFMHKSHKKLIREFDDFEVEDDMSFRSLCSQGFAKEFFKANR